MARGITMDRARRIAGGTTLTISEVAAAHRIGDRPGLRCYYERCTAGIRFRKGHSRAKGTPQETRVSAHFFLAAGQEHAPNCGFNVRSAITQLVRQSQAVEETRDLFGELRGGRFVIRLQVLNEGMKRLRNYEQRARRDNSPPVGNDYQRDARVMPMYFRSAVGVARVRSLVEDIGELEHVLSIQANGQDLSWDDFFFPLSRLDELFHACVNGIDHPVAFEFRVRDWRIAEPGTVVVQGFARYASRIASHNEILTIVPRLWVPEGLEAALEPQRTYVVLGKPRCRVNERFGNMNVTIYDASQWAMRIDEIGPDNDGEDERDE